MYQIGEKVIYGIHGVCAVVDQEQKVVDKKPVTYLILEPVGQAGARFMVPTHNAAAMAKVKPMLSADALRELIGSEEVRTSVWIPVENLRKQAYRELISGGDRMKLMQMLHSLYLHKADQAATGKKVHLCDENFLRDAEKLLIEETSMVLEIPADQARSYIREQLK